MVNTQVAANTSVTMRMIMGYAKNKAAALDIIQKLLKPEPADPASLPEKKKRALLIGHGEIPPGTPQPYSEFTDGGNKLRVLTPYTPRPIDHAVSNAVHSVIGDQSRPAYFLQR